jgi:hypothetical protein
MKLYQDLKEEQMKEFFIIVFLIHLIWIKNLPISLLPLFS